MLIIIREIIQEGPYEEVVGNSARLSCSNEKKDRVVAKFPAEK